MPGLVVVGKIGDDLRMDYTAVGDTPNLAARLQQMARPGSVAPSSSSYAPVVVPRISPRSSSAASAAQP